MANRKDVRKGPIIPLSVVLITTVDGTPTLASSTRKSTLLPGVTGLTTDGLDGRGTSDLKEEDRWDSDQWGEHQESFNLDLEARTLDFQLKQIH
jgi:hypothetical protein